MLIRKNTKAFKTILEIFQSCKDRPDREKLIRLYITRAGHSIKDRINVEGIEGDSALFYDLNYHSVLSNLESSERQLQQSDDVPGIYFFHSSSNKVWDETPFEFDEAIEKEFVSLPDLPVVRKKEKAEKFVFPAPGKKPAGEKEASPPQKKGKSGPVKEKKEPEKKASQPDYKLKHEIEFTVLDKTIFRKPQLTKKDILDYYNKISEHILPYLKDRPLSIRRHSVGGGQPLEMTFENLFGENAEELPKWIPTKRIGSGKSQKEMLLCYDREDLLYYVESGCLQFNPYHSKAKSIDSPDYLVLVIDSPEYEIKMAVEAALILKAILDALKLPSFVKTDGTSALHVYIPLDSKSEFQACRDAASDICKLLRLKAPNLIALQGDDESTYGKVTLDYLLNDEGSSLIAPYSMVYGDSPVIATPLLWDEVEQDLRSEEFNHETIFKRLKKVGDPFDALFKKKINADELLERLEANYAFLF